MKPVAVIGSLNCDFVMRASRRPQKGETVIGTSFNTFVGGKGNNQALACARAGAQVSMIGRIGADPFGRLIAEKLAESGVDCAYLFSDPSVGTGVADILIDADGDNSICVAPQANARLSPGDIEAAAPAIARAGVVLLQLEIPHATVAAAARLAKASGATVVLNPAPVPPEGVLPADLLSHTDILVPNQIEAEMLTGMPVKDLAGAVAAARRLQELGPRHVIVTLGALGALLLDDAGRAVTIPAFEVAVEDTTAAGDAFCGALVAALASGEALSDALVWGAAGGALACTRLGAEPSLPMREELTRLVALRRQQSGPR
jgi:ribokinase